MAVLLNRYLIMLVLSFISHNSFGLDNNASREDKIVSLALSEFMNAKDNVEIELKKCEQLEKDNVLPTSLFDSIDIAQHQLKVALFYFNREAREVCEGDYLARFFVAGSKYRLVAKNFNRVADEALSYTDDLLYGSYWRWLGNKVDYYSIETEKRERLEKIIELKSPFNWSKTVMLLGID